MFQSCILIQKLFQKRKLQENYVRGNELFVVNGLKLKVEWTARSQTQRKNKAAWNYLAREETIFSSSIHLFLYLFLQHHLPFLLRFILPLLKGKNPFPFVPPPFASLNVSNPRMNTFIVFSHRQLLSSVRARSKLYNK